MAEYYKTGIEIINNKYFLWFFRKNGLNIKKMA